MAVTKVRLSSDILSKVVTITVLFETTIIQLKPTADLFHCLINFNCLVIIYFKLHLLNGKLGMLVSKHLFLIEPVFILILEIVGY